MIIGEYTDKQDVTWEVHDILPTAFVDMFLCRTYRPGEWKVMVLSRNDIIIRSEAFAKRADKSRQYICPIMDVDDFHRKFKLDYDGPPRELDGKTQEFRDKRLHEEVQEYDQAVRDGDLEGQLDALVDLVYIALGTANALGLSGWRFREAWSRVHHANMQKVLASKENPSKFGELGFGRDIVKPAGWKSPDLTDLVKP